MVDQQVNITEIENSDYTLLDQFLQNAGRSLSYFRYFNSRPKNVIENHEVTAILIYKRAAVGYGHLDKEGDVIWLGIAVSELVIGKGFGKLMMSFLIQKAVDKNLPVISLTVHKNNTKAIGLYNRFGFIHVRDISEQVQLMEWSRNFNGK